MKKFWKIYSWIYLGAILFAIFYYALKPIRISGDVSHSNYIIAYVLVSISWLIPVIGLFLYSFNKKIITIFWKFFFVYFCYNFITMLIEFYRSGEFPILLPFHAIALVGLFMYSFTDTKRE